jgi:hypothetical protein
LPYTHCSIVVEGVTEHSNVENVYGFVEFFDFQSVTRRTRPNELNVPLVPNESAPIGESHSWMEVAPEGGVHVASYEASTWPHEDLAFPIVRTPGTVIPYPPEQPTCASSTNQLVTRILYVLAVLFVPQTNPAFP